MALRLGVDIGGTFTKAVALEGDRLLASATVPTTHREGVAQGVVSALGRVWGEVGREPVDLAVLSTTQAVNALLEGDTPTVGILALARTRHRREALRRTRLGPVLLGPGKALATLHTFLPLEGLTREAVRSALEDLARRGAEAVAISGAFSVEDPEPELMALKVAEEMGLPATAGHQMTGLYGLEVRTFTAVVNASLLPAMVRTLREARAGLRALGLTAPLMVMQGDLRVEHAETAERRPLLAVLSGPAASVAGALHYHRLLEGVFLEVGGTSTNLGAVRHGRPAMRYVRIMDFPTALRSVDVRVGGCAGGSLVRLRGRRFLGVGPRSARIAGLPYPSFLPPGSLPEDLRVAPFSPRPGDPEEYLTLVDGAGRRYALTPTDASNALGLLPEGDYARGDPENARRALSALARYLGRPVEETAWEVLERATASLLPAVRALLKEHRLRRPALVGLGGGASVLGPPLARSLGLPFQRVPFAEVISAIGSALTPVGVEMERDLPGGDEGEAVARWVASAMEQAVRQGADPETLQVFVEPLEGRRGVRVRAVGSLRRAERAQPPVEEAIARRQAGEAMRLAPASLRLAFENAFFRLYEGEQAVGLGPFRRRRYLMALVDREGAVRMVLEGGAWRRAEPGEALHLLEGREPPARLALVRGPYLVDLVFPRPSSLRPLLQGLDRLPLSEPVLMLWEA